MELQTPLRFHATVLCWTQGSEVQKIEVSRSFAHNNPYLDFLQGANSAIEYPNTDFYFHFPIDTNVQIWIMNTSQQHSKTRKGIELGKTPSLPRKRMIGARTTVKRGEHQKDPECA